MTTDPARRFAFIRAINVGGRRLSNDDLVRPFIDVGMHDVAAYQAAGNIAYRNPEGISDDRLRSALAASYGFGAEVFTRSLAEVRDVVDGQPFDPADVAGTEGRIQVAFLHSAPDDGSRADVSALVPDGDRVVFAGREWFWLPERGIGTSKLPVGRVEDLVGPMTIRTLGTVSRMVDKFG